MFIKENTIKKNVARKVLVIDDDRRVCETIRSLLSYNDEYEVIVAMTGREGLKAARRNHPDIILLDIKMPGMHGIDVLKRLKHRKRTCRIPIIMITGLNDETIIRSAMYEYAQQFIVKPFSLEELSSAIKRTLATAEKIS